MGPHRRGPEEARNVVIDEALREADQKMAKAVEVAKDDFAAIRTGRAHPSMFSNIVADYYGSPTPLQQLAGFQVPDPRTVLISPYDKGAMPAIEKAIRDSDMGVNPGNDGSVIRITMPQLTEERRKEYIKVAKTKGEDAKVSVRSIRRHAMDLIGKSVKDGEAGEDEGKSAEKRLDGMTKKYVDSIDQLLKHKEAELLEV
jgi:ribosome recycling factor